jgi:hypothetical protein
MDPHQGGSYQRPTVGHDNRPIGQRPWEGPNHRMIPPNQDHMGIINHPGVLDNIRRTHERWNTNDHGYYWHQWNGHWMHHHYDERGYHWWGFYIGDFYFSTRYWNNYYWWYDPYWHRWVYLRGNNWWWQDPVRPTIIYIYRDGSYYQYGNSVGGVVLNPDPTPPVEAPPADPTPAPAPAPETKAFYSADGTRTVQVFGADKDAFLYDTAETPAFEPKWLDSGVTEVRFKLDDQDQLVNIMTLKDDGGFNLFDKDGNAMSIQPVPQPVEAPGSDGNSTSSIGQSLEKSALFNALKTGSVDW